MQPLASFVGSADCGGCSDSYEGGFDADPRSWDGMTWAGVILALVLVAVVVWLAYTYWPTDEFTASKIGDESKAQVSHFHWSTSGPARPAPVPYNHHLQEVAQGDFQKIVNGVNQFGWGGPLRRDQVSGPTKECFGDGFDPSPAPETSPFDAAFDFSYN